MVQVQPGHTSPIPRLASAPPPIRFKSTQKLPDPVLLPFCSFLLFRRGELQMISEGGISRDYLTRFCAAGIRLPFSAFPGQVSGRSECPQHKSAAKSGLFWRALRDSNPRPSDPKSLSSHVTDVLKKIKVPIFAELFSAQGLSKAP